MLQAALEVSRRVLGHGHPLTLTMAHCLQELRCAMHAEQPTKRGGKPAARRKERTGASPTCDGACGGGGEGGGGAAGVLELEEGAAGSAKGKAKGNKTKRG